MNSIEFYESLKYANSDDDRYRAIAKAIESKSNVSDVATKQDIKMLEERINSTSELVKSELKCAIKESKIDLIKWNVTLIVLNVASVIAAIKMIGSH